MWVGSQLEGCGVPGSSLEVEPPWLVSAPRVTCPTSQLSLPGAGTAQDCRFSELVSPPTQPPGSSAGVSGPGVGAGAGAGITRTYPHTLRSLQRFGAVFPVE